MKEIILTEEQREKLMDALESVHDECGRFDLDVEFDDFTIRAVGYVEADGYREDDYLDGTGAWVETYRNASVELTAYDDYSKEYSVDNATQLAAESLLNEAA